MKPNSLPTLATVLIATCLISMPSFARPMVYDGYLTDLNDQPVEALVNLRFALYGERLGGEALWEELVSDVSVRNGAFRVSLGRETPFPSGLFQRGDLFLGIAVDEGDELSPRQRLGAVPFAQQAGDVANRHIHPSSVSIGEQLVIDESGNWVGPEIAAAGERGP